MDIKRLADKLHEKDLSDPSVLGDLFETIRLIEAEDFADAHARNKEIRALSARYVKQRGDAKMLDLNKRSLLFDAPHDFDAYCRYIEWNREKEKRFYMPRRKQLKKVADALQMLGENKLDLLAISMPPGVGKTTTALFFLTWLAGKNPGEAILSMSHNNAFLNGVYSECLRIMQPDGEYLWHDVFPDVSVINTNAKDMMIDLGRTKKDGKRFMTLEFSSIGSGNAGKVRAEQLLYCDDLVEGIEQAMSKEQMDKLWQKYTDDAVQRKIGAHQKELHIATRWSVHDVIGRLERSRQDDPKAKFIVMPALDENGESNFNYPYGLGMDTQKYNTIRDMMDDVSWKALYMNQPIEREGQLYNEDELRRYFELPEGEPDAILSICDTKDKGEDYAFMPVAYQYGNDFYIEFMLCDNGAPEVVEARLVSVLLQHNVQMSRFESNSAGGKVAEKVQAEVKKMGGRTRITTKYTTANKETKIIVNSPWVKEYCLFKDESVIKHDKEYRRAINFLCGYTMAGRNKHDDVPDGMAMLAEFVQSLEANTVTVFRRPF